MSSKNKNANQDYWGNKYVKEVVVVVAVVIVVCSDVVWMESCFHQCCHKMALYISSWFSKIQSWQSSLWLNYLGLASAFIRFLHKMQIYWHKCIKKSQHLWQEQRTCRWGREEALFGGKFCILVVKSLFMMPKFIRGVMLS